MANKKYTLKQKEMRLGGSNLNTIYGGESKKLRFNEINRLLKHVDRTIITLELQREDLLKEKSIILLSERNKE